MVTILTCNRLCCDTAFDTDADDHLSWQHEKFSSVDAATKAILSVNPMEGRVLNLLDIGISKSYEGKLPFSDIYK